MEVCFMKTVGEILKDRTHKGVYSVEPDENAHLVAQLMKAKNIGAVAVMSKDDLLVGIVSERDLMNKVTEPGLDPRLVTAVEIMSREVVVVSPEENWEDCLAKMQTNHCRHLPVMENGRLVGLISLRDLLGLDGAQLLDIYLWDRERRQETFSPAE